MFRRSRRQDRADDILDAADKLRAGGGDVLVVSGDRDLYSGARRCGILFLGRGAESAHLYDGGPSSAFRSADAAIALWMASGWDGADHLPWAGGRASTAAK